MKKIISWIIVTVILLPVGSLSATAAAESNIYTINNVEFSIVGCASYKTEEALYPTIYADSPCTIELLTYDYAVDIEIFKAEDDSRVGDSEFIKQWERENLKPECILAAYGYSENSPTYTHDLSVGTYVLLIWSGGDGEFANLIVKENSPSVKLPPALNTSEWAANEVQKAYEAGLIPEEMISDDLCENITRAEFAAVAVKLNRILQDAEFNWHGGYITDIDDNPYEMYIREAYALGITNGTGEEDGGIVFSPDLTITREQLATMLCRVMISKMMSGDFYYFAHPLDVVNMNVIKELADYTEISDYAEKPICYLLENKVINGIDETHFAPKNTATKEQAIIIALRIYEYFNYQF